MKERLASALIWSCRMSVSTKASSPRPILPPCVPISIVSPPSRGRTICAKLWLSVVLSGP